MGTSVPDQRKPSSGDSKTTTAGIAQEELEHFPEEPARVPAFPNASGLDTMDGAGPTELLRGTRSVPESIMSSSPNGQHQSHREPIRRLRYDDLASLVVR